MGSFGNPHRIYLFDMKNGKKKLAYGQSPEDALKILSYRLPQEEMDEIIKDKCVQINQQQLQEYVHFLG
jgi:hypothetical protein